MGAEYKESVLPVKKVVLFQSGVGYFEHSGGLNGESKITLRFTKPQMDDALKSLTIYDEASKTPFVSYQNEATITQTLESVKVDLRNPSIENILTSLQGENIEITTTRTIAGKIVGVQTRSVAASKNGADGANESVLTLLIDGGAIAQFAIKEIQSYKFADPKISKEIEKTLAFLSSVGDMESRTLSIHLDGAKKRDARISYVLAAPVWKTNYRLDLGAQKPFLQGWAIVDNASDNDWESVELSLAAGRITSFTQPYYAPYFTIRPALPLSIEGFAQARTYASGYSDDAAEIEAVYEAEDMAFEPERHRAAMPMMRTNMQEAKIKSVATANYQTAAASGAGDQFYFTPKGKVSIERRKSAMVPLAQGALDARKVTIFSTVGGNSAVLGIEIKNNLEIKLPSGAVTIFDGGIYAGDALLDFLPQNEKRLISYGDDLSVRGTIADASKTTIEGVKVAKGVMTISQKTTYSKEYVFKNSAEFAKTLILEHPIARDAKLVVPAQASEKTDLLYRFEVKLAANKETKFAVQEEANNKSQVRISGVPFESIAIYSVNTEYPAELRNALKKAETLAGEISKRRAEADKARKSYDLLVKEQERLRENIKAVGAQSQLGNNYAQEMAAIDESIKTALKNMSAAETAAAKAQSDYSEYIAKIEI
ncbi:hypothetical protein FACS189487_02750 [Campylobacterota bacterium]|nr:hypothetical protein FACS189487_02750 [Campylobacterota bacterium]